MNKLALLACAASILLMAGCMTYRAPVMPPVGLIYEDVKSPMDVDYDVTKTGSKTGTALSTSILSLIAYGDCSTRAAAADGNLSVIYTADYHFYNILGVYQTFTTIVYGE